MMMMMIMIIYKSLISLKIILFEKLPLFCKFDNRQLFASEGATLSGIN